MLGRTRLKHKRIAVLAADGFEKLELTAPVDALRAQGARVEIVSLYPGRIRAVNLNEPAGRMHVDRILSDATPHDYDALLIPGGFVSPDMLRQSAQAREFVRAFDLAHKPIAAVGHGPWVLASSGLVRGRTMASWPGMRDDLVNAGANWLDRAVVRDGNWITSRGPQDTDSFARAVCELFAEDWPIAAQAELPAWSDPQRLQPFALMPAVMRFLPRPSIRILLGLAMVGAGFLLATRLRQGGVAGAA